MNNIGKLRLLFVGYMLASTPVMADLQKIHEKKWIHGSEDCGTNADSAIDVLAFDKDTYILRQNKCIDAEAPFMYVLFGEHTVFLQDTGATESADIFPLYTKVQELITDRTADQDLKILVTHSHGHGDHKAGDIQFRGMKNVELVAADLKNVKSFFGFDVWPEGEAQLDLGGRVLTVFPTPGHQEASIAVYDPHTRWLLTGDSFYPGYLYIKDWNAYKESISKLVRFSEQHPVSAIMGTHIEMSDEAGQPYALGSSFQPNEASLALFPEDLKALDHKLVELGDSPKRVTLDKFVIRPLSWFERFLSNLLR